MTLPIAMTIAGSDSGAGAGIQADLKTFAALGVYGTTVLTAITAQNTQRVTQVLELAPELVWAQLAAVMEDMGAQAAKTGMLANAAIIRAVAEGIQEYGLEKLVVDPVMVAKSGDPLLQPAAVTALREQMVPLAEVITPNLPEAQVLVGRELESPEEVRAAAREIRAMGARHVVIKGGHGSGPATDLFYDGREFREYSAPRIQTPHTHGTGCTFSAAIAAYLAKGAEPALAVERAKDYITQAIRRSYPIGKGRGPVHHFYEVWP